MKVLLFVVLAGLAIAVAGCGTAVDPTPTPTPTVTVTATPVIETPTPTPQAVELNYDEQRTFDFIDEQFPILRERNYQLTLVLDNPDSTYYEGIKALGNCANVMLKIKRIWNRLDWSYGVVSDLEDDFNVYVNASTRYYKAWAGALEYGVTNARANDAYYARERMDTYEARVENHIDEVRALVDGTVDSSYESY